MKKGRNKGVTCIRFYTRGVSFELGFSDSEVLFFPLSFLLPQVMILPEQAKTVQ